MERPAPLTAQGARGRAPFFDHRLLQPSSHQPDQPLASAIAIVSRLRTRRDGTKRRTHKKTAGRYAVRSFGRINRYRPPASFRHIRDSSSVDRNPATHTHNQRKIGPTYGRTIRSTHLRTHAQDLLDGTRGSLGVFVYDPLCIHAARARSAWRHARLCLPHLCIDALYTASLANTRKFLRIVRIRDKTHKESTNPTTLFGIYRGAGSTKQQQARAIPPQPPLPYKRDPRNIPRPAPSAHGLYSSQNSQLLAPFLCSS